MLSRVAVGCLLGAALIAASGVRRAPATTTRTWGSTPKSSAASWKASACAEDGQSINYEERAPLVIPPSTRPAAAGADRRRDRA